MQAEWVIGGFLLLIAVIFLIVLAPSMKGRGFRTSKEKAEYKLKRETPTDDVERHRRRYFY